MKSRWSDATVAALALVLIALAIHASHTFLNLDRSMEIYDLNQKESIRLASNLFFQKMTAIAQVTTGLLAGAWAVVTFDETRVKVEGSASVSCFVLANVALGLSLVTYAFGYDFIVSRIFHHASVDIDASFIWNVQASQQLLFVHGLVCLGFCLLFGRRPR